MNTQKLHGMYIIQSIKTNKSLQGNDGLIMTGWRLERGRDGGKKGSF